MSLAGTLGGNTSDQARPFEKGAGFFSAFGADSRKMQKGIQSKRTKKGEEKMTVFDAENCTQLQIIGDAAFYGNDELNVLRLGTTIPPTVGNMSFLGISEAAVLSVPASNIIEYKNNDSWSSVFKIIKGL